MKYTKEQIETIASELRNMPPIKANHGYSKQEAIKMLAKEIASLQKRGYTLDQVAETLSGKGISIATPTLKNYLQRAKAKSLKGAYAKARRDGKDTHSEQALVSTQESTNAVVQNKTEFVQNKATFVPRPDSDDL